MAASGVGTDMAGTVCAEWALDGVVAEKAGALRAEASRSRSSVGSRYQRRASYFCVSASFTPCVLVDVFTGPAGPPVLKSKSPRNTRRQYYTEMK